ncbi:MAG: hypothetical protein R3248_02840 [Candidatus Promineifilaceae bacterium]|nr:hypothetical protein [Candidatus Promineifilaceae bacterium]
MIKRCMQRVDTVRPAAGFRRSFGGPLLLFLLFLLALAAAAAAAHAHGGGTPQLENAPAGPYVVSAWTTPDPPRVGAYHVTVGVARPDEAGNAGEPVLGANVTVRLTPQTAAAEPLVAQASNEAADNKLFYEADVELPAPGAYDVQIAVDGPDGEGGAGFTIEAQEGGGVNWALVGAAGVALVAVLFFVGQTVRGQGSQSS